MVEILAKSTLHRLWNPGLAAILQREARYVQATPGPRCTPFAFGKLKALLLELRPHGCSRRQDWTRKGEVIGVARVPPTGHEGPKVFIEVKANGIGQQWARWNS